MICPYCGKENPAESAVCSFCGGPLTETSGLAAKGEPTAPLYEVIKSPQDTPLAPAETSQPSSAPQQSYFPPAQAQTPARGGIYGSRVWWIVGCLVFVCLLLGCIAAALAIYRYTNVSGFLHPPATSPIEPTAQGQAQSITANTAGSSSVSGQQSPTVLYSDDFSDTSSGWPQVDEADFSAAYYEGAYRMVVKSAMWDSWSIPNDNAYTDVMVEVDATKNSGPDDNDFGLICRYQDSQHFYYAVITSDGLYGIAKVTGDSTETLGTDQFGSSNLIKQGFDTNHIRFDCVGDKLALYVNGQAVDQVTDGEYSIGNAGLIAGTYKNPGADILFDNFKVTSQ